MKWINSGHEFDKKFNDLQLDEKKDINLYIWGAGEFGKICLKKVKRAFNRIKFIDSDKNKTSTQVDGIDVIHRDEYFFEKNDIVVIGVANELAVRDIENRLRKLGLEKNRNYFYFDNYFKEILNIIMVYKYGKLYLPYIQIALTERCTLKCKKCCHACYAVDVNDESKDLSLENILQTIDSFFENVDFVDEFVLLGGESLLYKSLCDVISYINGKYRERIDLFYIITNGTVVPSENLLEVSKRSDLYYVISDYSINDKISKIQKKFIKILEANGVSYKIDGGGEWWYDFGLGEVNNETNESNVFENCIIKCPEIRYNKYYYCIMARSVSENLNLNIGQEDYFIMNNTTDKKKFLEYSMGYSEKGYLEMCKYCRGGNEFTPRIVAGEQISI